MKNPGSPLRRASASTGLFPNSLTALHRHRSSLRHVIRLWS
jgi:hypothetical protein